MKIAITGHKRGIGQEFARQLSDLGHEIVGISRSDGENIRRTAHTASIIEPCDMLINNAISFYAQTELLFEVWHMWQSSEEVHHIWNISTKVCEWKDDKQINGLTMRQSLEYRNQKMALELAHAQLRCQPSKIKMELIRPGSVNTQTFSDPDSVSADEYVSRVLTEQGLT
jgi:NAD(P)-dependent dehydrogenase (short-subunit alcohol dehydrogenase family)|tara:strand:+ start:1226 stop:1735 length:510 start_codon:yes stop_codon:yes gene_type:complete